MNRSDINMLNEAYKQATHYNGADPNVLHAGFKNLYNDIRNILDQLDSTQYGEYSQSRLI